MSLAPIGTVCIVGAGWSGRQIAAQLLAHGLHVSLYDLNAEVIDSAKIWIADHIEEQMASGQSRFENQVGWARYYLVRAGYIDASKRGVWALTEKGRIAATLSKAEVATLVRDVIAEWGSRPETAPESAIEPSEAPPPDESMRDHRAVSQSITGMTK